MTKKKKVKRRKHLNEIEAMAHRAALFLILNATYEAMFTDIRKIINEVMHEEEKE